jgi:hypothetical protein
LRLREPDGQTIVPAKVASPELFLGLDLECCGRRAPKSETKILVGAAHLSPEATRDATQEIPARRMVATISTYRLTIM